jgi:broad specificity phosphatase PhoE
MMLRAASDQRRSNLGKQPDDLPAMSSASVTTLYIARHGQSEWNNQRRITGQLNPNLSPKGRQQSTALADCLRDENLNAIYTSQLQRTIDTALPTAMQKQLSVTSLAALNEIHFGPLQGRYRDERDPQARDLWAYLQEDLWGHQVPGAEPMEAFAHRVSQALQEILLRHQGHSILIVGHRGTNRVLLGTLFGWQRERWKELRLRNKYFYRVRPGVTGVDDYAGVATLTLSGDKTGTCHDGFIM